MRPTVTRPVQDPLAMSLFDNWLFMNDPLPKRSGTCFRGHEDRFCDVIKNLEKKFCVGTSFRCWFDLVRVQFARLTRFDYSEMKKKFVYWRNEPTFSSGFILFLNFKFIVSSYLLCAFNLKFYPLLKILTEFDYLKVRCLKI